MICNNKKLDKNGRDAVCQRVYRYELKDNEYWTKVFKRKPARLDFVLRLVNCSKNTMQMITDHKEYFDTYMSDSDKLYFGMLKFSEYLDKHGFDLDNLNSCEIFASPYIPESFFNELVKDQYGDEVSTLNLLYNLFEDEYMLDEYVVLLPNSVLTAAGFNAVQDVSENSLDQLDACSDGTEFAKGLFERFGTEIITWDFIVKHLRDNPHEFKDETRGYISWWWSASHWKN